MENAIIVVKGNSGKLYLYEDYVFLREKVYLEI